MPGEKRYLRQAREHIIRESNYARWETLPQKVNQEQVIDVHHLKEKTQPLS